MSIKLRIKSAQEGDLDSIVSLISDRKIDYYKLALSYLKNSEDSLDAIEDMTVKIFYDITKLKKPKSFYSWSNKILVNICLNYIKVNKRFIYIEDLNDFEEQKNTINIDLSMDLEKYLCKINHKQREAIELKYYEDLDYKTISTKINVPVGTVKSRIFNGLKNLKKNIEGEFL